MPWMCYGCVVYHIILHRYWNASINIIFKYSGPSSGTISSTTFTLYPLQSRVVKGHINLIKFATYPCQYVVNLDWLAFWTENGGIYHKVERNILLTHTNPYQYDMLLFTHENVEHNFVTHHHKDTHYFKQYWCVKSLWKFWDWNSPSLSFECLNPNDSAIFRIYYNHNDAMVFHSVYYKLD